MSINRSKYGGSNPGRKVSPQKYSHPQDSSWHQEFDGSRKHSKQGPPSHIPVSYKPAFQQRQPAQKITKSMHDKNRKQALYPYYQSEESVTPPSESSGSHRGGSRRGSKKGGMNMVLGWGEDMLQQMGEVNNGVEELEKKFMSVELFVEELKQTITQYKMSRSEVQSLANARSRQHKFVIAQYQKKVTNLKLHNQALQGEIGCVKKAFASKEAQLVETQQELVRMRQLSLEHQKLKSDKQDVEERLEQRQSELNELITLEQQMQAEIDRLSKAQRQRSEVLGREKVDSGSLKQEVEWLMDKVANLQHENKQYEKCLSSRNGQLERQKRSAEDSRQMLEKTKTMKLELEEELQLMRRKSLQKQMEGAQRIRSLSQQLKSSNKHHSEQLRAFAVRLDSLFRKLPHGIRRQFSTKVTSSPQNTIDNCMGGIEQFVAQIHPQQEAVTQHLTVIHSVTLEQLHAEGLVVCLAHVQKQRQQEVAKQHDVELQLKEKVDQVKSLQSQLSVAQKKLNSVKNEPAPPTKQPLLPLHPTPSLQKHQSSQMQNANESIKLMMEESHQKYLEYQQQIAELQLSIKRLNSNIKQAQEAQEDLEYKLKNKQTELSKEISLRDSARRQKEELSAKIRQITVQNKKQSSESEMRASRAQSERDILKKKVQKYKYELQNSDKNHQAQLQVKDKTITELRQGKQSLSLETQFLQQQLQFAKFMQSSSKQGNSGRSSLGNEQDPELQRFKEREQSWVKQLKQLRTYNQQLTQKHKQLQAQNKAVKQSEKDVIKKVESLNSQIQQKSDQVEQIRKDTAEQLSRKDKLGEQYKKAVERLKADNQEVRHWLEEEKERRSRDKIKAQKQAQEDAARMKEARVELQSERTKAVDLEQKMSGLKREQEQCLRVVDKRDRDIRDKEEQLVEGGRVLEQSRRKVSVLERELLQRQDLLKKSESLMEGLVEQDRRNKQALYEKEEEIMQLIQQKEALSYRLNQDLDAKSDNMRALRGNLEDEATVLKQTITMLEKQIEELRQKLAAKQAQMRSMLKTADFNKKRNILSDTINEECRQQIQELEEKGQSLANQLDIAQDDLEESYRAREELQLELQNCQKEKARFYKKLEEKYAYIEELEAAVQLKVNESQEFEAIVEAKMEEARKDSRLKVEELTEEVEILKEEMEELEAKGVEAMRAKGLVIEQREEEVKELKKNMQLKKTELQEREERIEQLQNLLEEKQMNITTKQAHILHKESQVQQIKEEYETLKLVYSQEYSNSNPNQTGQNEYIGNLQEELKAVRLELSLLQMKYYNLCQEVADKEEQPGMFEAEHNWEGNEENGMMFGDIEQPEEPDLFDIGEAEEEEEVLKRLQFQQSRTRIGLIGRQYLLGLQREVNDILGEEEKEEFGVEFVNLHSTSAVQVLDQVGYQLSQYRQRQHQEMFSEMAFIEQVQTDFCQDLEVELDEAIGMMNQPEVQVQDKEKEEVQLLDCIE